MSFFRNLLGKSRKIDDTIEITPTSLEFAEEGGEKFINIKTNNTWNLLINYNNNGKLVNNNS